MTLRSSYDVPQSLIQFCALAYNPQASTQFVFPTHQIIIFLVQDQFMKLRILVSPEWQQIVQPKDYAYIAEILADFRERARSAPEALLEQASSLSVGPLVTHASGVLFEEQSDLYALSIAFIEF